jgi:hypothetical protein
MSSYSSQRGWLKLLCTIKTKHPMRTHFPLPFALACIMAGAQPTGAQVTILPADVMQVGDRYRLAVDETPTVGFGRPGNNMTWILNGLNSTWEYSIETMLAVDAPLGAVAPGTIATVTSLDNSAYHFDVDADELLYTGDSWDGDGTPMGMAYSPPRVQLKFPAQAGQQHSATSRSVLEWHVGEDIGWGFVVDSVRRRTHYAYSYVIDGWGYVSIPLGFLPCIRVNTLITTTDSIDAKPVGSSTWQTDIELMNMDTREVAFWSPQHSLPVVRMIDAGDAGMPSAVVWIVGQELSSGVQEPRAAATFTMHPNPAKDRVEVAMPGEGEKRYRLMSAEGRVVQEGRVMGARGTIPLQHVAPGTYVLELRDGRRVAQQRLVKQ